MEVFEEREFVSFNDFFTRKFRPDARFFAKDQNTLPAFAEGRYLAFEKSDDIKTYPVKGVEISLSSLFNNEPLAKLFSGGPLFIARLCPTDYHRFHYPDEGMTQDHYRVSGPLHSVNPLALLVKPDILVTNERVVSILQTKNFGRLAYIEVGATCVGHIVQSHSLEKPFCRGDEKGYFLFGGSTVILLGEPGRWNPDGDLLEQTKAGRETLVLLGEKIAKQPESKND